jgi:hypothetical protein
VSHFITNERLQLDFLHACVCCGACNRPQQFVDLARPARAWPAQNARGASPAEGAAPAAGRRGAARHSGGAADRHVHGAMHCRRRGRGGRGAWRCGF